MTTFSVSDIVNVIVTKGSVSVLTISRGFVVIATVVAVGITGAVGETVMKCFNYINM